MRFTPIARKQLAEIDRVLQEAYGTPEKCLDNKDDPLDEAIYIILSFQTDLARLIATWSRLRASFPNWEVLDHTPVRQVATVLREAGLHRQKAQLIKSLLKEVKRRIGRLSLDSLRDLPDDDAEYFLTRLPGLSWKGARCVLLYSLRRDVFPVDSNTFRVLKRTGFLSSSAIYRRRSLHDAVQLAVPPRRRRALHVNLVVHGQRTCTPIRPRCPSCPLLSMCSMRGVPRTIRDEALAVVENSTVQRISLPNSRRKSAVPPHW